MTGYGLDLRSHKCPMALLLAKRYLAQQAQAQSQILVRDLSSKQDIERYLQHSKLTYQCHVSDDYFSFHIIKEMASDV